MCLIRGVASFGGGCRPLGASRSLRQVFLPCALVVDEFNELVNVQAVHLLVRQGVLTILLFLPLLLALGRRLLTRSLRASTVPLLLGRLLGLLSSGLARLLFGVWRRLLLGLVSLLLQPLRLVCRLPLLLLALFPLVLTL